MKIARTAAEMISGMKPELRQGEFVFVSTGDATLAASLAASAISVFHEDEGTSLIIPLDLARDVALPADTPMRCITLAVHSALDGVGLTSAVSAALADCGIPCNMVAAYHHDHAFVPSAMADRAVAALTSLADRTRTSREE